jgi:pimeloyl-ACP methyl ester carboxylesterase
VTSALALNRPVLVGHSVGGQELSSVATRYPGRVAGLVYLEAAYPYAVDNDTGPTLDAMQKLRPPCRCSLEGEGFHSSMIGRARAFS